jgi:hypothetical protein
VWFSVICISFMARDGEHFFMCFRGICCYLPFCISDFTDLGFFFPHFSQVCQGSVNLVYFFKEPAFYFIVSLYVYFLFLFD